MSPITIGPGVLNLSVPTGWVKLAAPDDPPLSLIVEMGDAAPIITQGYGGWDEVERQGRTALTTWRGFQPLGVRLSVLLDGHVNDQSVEEPFARIEAMAGRGEQRHGGQPPTLIVDTAGVMQHDHTVSADVRWVIDNLDPVEDTIITNATGDWVRVALNIDLLQHVTDQGFAAASAAARARIHKGRKPRKPMHARSNDTLLRIARDKLGDVSRWPELSKANGIRDPSLKLKRGRLIRFH